jgi:hypothetical protein
VFFEVVFDRPNLVRYIKEHIGYQQDHDADCQTQDKIGPYDKQAENQQDESVADKREDDIVYPLIQSFYQLHHIYFIYFFENILSSLLCAPPPISSLKNIVQEEI